LKNDMKVDNLMKMDVKMNVKMNSLIKMDVLTKTSPALKSQLKSILDVGLNAPLITTPTFKTPTFTPPKVPTPVIPIALWLGNKRSKKKKKGFDQAFNEKAFLPDFTSRSLGLTQTVSEKKLMAKINKMQSGLEIRRGVKIK